MTAFAHGPATSNVLTAIAFRLHGWKGMVLGSIAALWPSFVLIMILAAVTRVLHNPWLSGALHGIECLSPLQHLSRMALGNPSLLRKKS